MIIAVDKIDLISIGNSDERCTIAELHGGHLILIECRPVGHSFCIRIPGLCKIDPIALDDLCKGCFSRILVTLPQEGITDIEDVVGMRDAVTGLVTYEAEFGRLGEEGCVNRRLARF